MKTTTQPEFIHIGKTFASRERAEKRQKLLESQGYTLVKKNSKTLTFKK